MVVAFQKTSLCNDHRPSEKSQKRTNIIVISIIKFFCLISGLNRLNHHLWSTDLELWGGEVGEGTKSLPAPLHASITSAWSHTFGDALGGARAHDEHRIVMRSRVLLRIGGRRERCALQARRLRVGGAGGDVHCRTDVSG